jgi:hypothetical protein
MLGSAEAPAFFLDGFSYFLSVFFGRRGSFAVAVFEVGSLLGREGEGSYVAPVAFLGRR